MSGGTCLRQLPASLTPFEAARTSAFNSSAEWWLRDLGVPQSDLFWSMTGVAAAGVNIGISQHAVLSEVALSCLVLIIPG